MQAQAATPRIPLKQLIVGFNPRKYFDPAKLASLTESVRERGVDTPITVRPVADGRYEIITGGRRYRAAMAARGEDYEIPVVIREVDDVEAKIIALTENAQRDDLAPSEEAVDAAELLGLHKGNRDETARILGWSRSTLDSRLALLNCSDLVLAALNERKITLGVGELLAALSKSNQDKVLPAIIEGNRSIADVRKLIESVSCSLTTAIFDRKDCAGCPHNSSVQQQMFGEAIGTGNCTNKTCYNEKTEAQLEATAAGLRDEVPVVRIVRAGDNHTRIQLVVDGDKGVGLEQAKACHACQNYGVAVSGLPDSLGKTFKGQCFDTVCNMKKVAARIRADKAAQQPASTVSKSKAAPAAPAAKAGQVATAETTVSVVAESEKVKAYRVKLWRKSLRKDIGLDHGLAREYLIALVATGHARDIDGSKYREFLSKAMKLDVPASDIAEAVTMAKGVPSDRQVPLVTAMLFTAIEGLQVHDLTALCKAHGLDLTKYWALDKEFLELVTKAEMMVVADELGIRAALGENFKKVFAKPKGEVIDALLAVEGFDYTGKLLKLLQF